MKQFLLFEKCLLILGFLTISIISHAQTTLAEGDKEAGDGEIISYSIFVSDLKTDNENKIVPDTNISENIPSVPTSINNTKEMEFKVYPNPASDYIHIQSDSEIEKISLISSSGAIVKVIDDCNSYSEAVTMNVSDCASGIYFVKVMGSNGSVLKKIVLK